MDSISYIQLQVGFSFQHTATDWIHFPVYSDRYTQSTVISARVEEEEDGDDADDEAAAAAADDDDDEVEAKEE